MSPFIRHEARSRTGAEHIAAYARAVDAMQRRRADDVTSWAYQAAMHGTTLAPPRPLWNSCQHGAWFFTSWHRMFLYYFEEVVRAAVIQTGGPRDWALPYWNYGLNGDYATIPLPFRDALMPDRSPNPLYVRERAPGINTGAQLPAQATTAAFALSRPQFVGATQFGGGAGGPSQFLAVPGALEQTPHNAVHGVVGGWMGNVLQAALDPIFWLHHSNIDRLWAVWQGGNAGTGDRAWLGQSFDFYDDRGARVSKTCQGVIRTIQDLDYDYDPAPAPPRTTAPVPPETIAARLEEDVSEPQIVGGTTEPLTLVGANVGAVVELDDRARTDAVASFRANAAPEATPTTVLTIDDIEGESNPDTVYGIYVNLPPDAPADQAELHHVGNLSFFGIERARDPQGDEHAHGLRVSIDITDTVAALKRRGLWGDDDKRVLVSLRPLGLIAGDNEEARADLKDLESAEHAPVTVGRIALFQG